MANSFIPFFLPLLVALITTTEVLRFVVVVVQGDPDLTYVSGYCGQEYDVSGFRMDQASRVASEAIEQTAPGGRVCSQTPEQPVMYYRSTCSDSVSQEDCSACLAYCKDQLVTQNGCVDYYGAQLTVASCSLRYETYSIPECNV